MSCIHEDVACLHLAVLTFFVKNRLDLSLPHMPDTRPLIPPSEPSQTRYDRAEEMENQHKRKKVLVVGAGAAGKFRDGY